MEIIYKKLTDIRPYEKNPRKNDEAVKYVANSIKEFGFKVPIIIDRDNVIIAGHTRYKASEQLGLDEVPCIIADDLSQEQIKAFRLADNRVAEKSEWDFDLMNEELLEIQDIFNMTDFAFEEAVSIDWQDVDNVDENNYEKPKHDYLECPKCHHVDRKEHFKKKEEQS